MHQIKTLTLYSRVILLFTGSVFITAMVYGVGKKIVPFLTPYDKVLLLACNPNTYVPVLDELMRALSDYTLFLIIAPLVSWTIAFWLYLVFLRHKNTIVTGLIVETILIVLFLLKGFFNNSHYFGVNIILFVSTALVLGTTTFLFYRMDINAMIRFSHVIWIIVLSVFLSDIIAMNWLKSEVARPRPLNNINSPWNKQLRVIPDENLRGKNSYPSGHTTGTVALLTPLFWYASNKKVKTGLLTWAFLVAFSRVYTVAHFPTCCLMGAFLSFSIGTMAYFLFPPPQQVSFTAGPSEKPESTA